MRRRSKFIVNVRLADLRCVSHGLSRSGFIVEIIASLYQLTLARVPLFAPSVDEDEVSN